LKTRWQWQGKKALPSWLGHFFNNGFLAICSKHCRS